ncbi:MAG: MurR/RpiR family transcriptional regulator [Rhizobiaceae bacterium]|nr:MurR/RpiR family transcriptional regulator [Rhizobiaceae bacterium]MCO5070606.1 MurR/RpiR family transcriptional regulator [Rhizobiaceae bacterium]
MTEPTAESVNSAVLRLRSIRSSLNPAERRVLDEVLSNPEAVVYGTLNKVAMRSSVSDATVVRFCRSAGYESFNDLKIQLAQPATQARRIQRDLSQDDTPGVILEKVFNANIRSLQDSLHTIDRGVFEKAVDAISAAPKVVFIGVGTSGTVALDAVQKFLVTGIHAVSYTDVVLQAHYAATCSADDVVVGLSQSGSTATVVAALSKAASRGATVISVTSNAKSPITSIAGLNIVLSVPDLSFQTATNEIRTAQLSVIDALCVSAAIRSPERYLKNSAQVEAASESLHLKPHHK